MILLDIVVAIAPVWGYYEQLKLIQRTGSVGTFSINVCAILMISGILRIFFWFTTGYAINLLFQAIFIIIIQGFLLYECLKLQPMGKDQPETFWKWPSFDHYIRFLSGMTAAITILTLLTSVLAIPYYGDLLGFTSLMIEATLGMPQLLSNHRNKSVQGLSYAMIMSWFVGDMFKTIYFAIEDQPFQFLLCGAIQLTVDVLIIGQIWLYTKPATKKYDPLPTQ